MNKRKDKPIFKVQINNSDTNCEINKDYSKSFVNNLIDDFKQGIYSLLESMRICKSKNVSKEMQTIINDEQQSVDNARKSLMK